MYWNISWADAPFPILYVFLRIIIAIILVRAQNEKEITHASKLPSLTRIVAYIIFIDIAIMNSFYLPVTFFSPFAFMDQCRIKNTSKKLDLSS